MRISVLRLAGARIGKRTSIFRGTTVLGLEHLQVGSSVSIGFRCLLDARGGLTIADRVVLASDTQIITASHDVESSSFAALMRPVVIGKYAWLASRVTVLPGVTIGEGSVAAACALVRENVENYAIVAGVPARVVGKRPQNLDYDPAYRPLFY